MDICIWATARAPISYKTRRFVLGQRMNRDEELSSTIRSINF